MKSLSQITAMLVLTLSVVVGTAHAASSGPTPTPTPTPAPTCSGTAPSYSTLPQFTSTTCTATCLSGKWNYNHCSNYYGMSLGDYCAAVSAGTKQTWYHGSLKANPAARICALVPKNVADVVFNAMEMSPCVPGRRC